jgi:hypothetical protein
MGSLMASLLLSVPLIQWLSRVSSIQSYVVFYQRAGSIWAFVVCEAKPCLRTCPQLEYIGVLSEAATLCWATADIDHARRWLVHLFYYFSRLTERQELGMILPTRKLVRNEIHHFSSPMCPGCQMMRPRTRPFSYCWERCATSTSPCTI